MKSMKTLLACACLLTAGTVVAQNYYLATQQARRQADNNNAEQQRIANAAGGAQATGPGAPAAAAPAPVDPALQATLANISGLQGNFAALVAAGDSADPAQKDSLRTNLAQASHGTKASADSVKKLADDLSTALTGKKKLIAAQQTKLAQEIHALFNSSHLTDAQQQKLVADAQKMLADAGASVDDAVNVATDLKAVVDQTK